MSPRRGADTLAAPGSKEAANDARKANSKIIGPERACAADVSPQISHGAPRLPNPERRSTMLVAPGLPASIVWGRQAMLARRAGKAFR